MGEIDIFDAGPLIQAEVAQLRTVRQNRTAVVREIVSDNGADAGPNFLLSNASLDFRACLGTPSEFPDGTVGLTPSLAEALQLRRGDLLSFSPLR
jgi:arginine N-succinyltransferase